MMQEHLLGGCTPTPLASYLKALGILRLVAEQKDPDIAGRWQGEQFVLRTILTREELERFFLEEYRPTPIVTPWNGRGGFLEGDEDEDESSDRAGAQMVNIYSDNTVADRFSDYKAALTHIKHIELLKQLNSERAKWKELRKLAEKKKAAKIKQTEAEKEQLKQAEKRAKTIKANLLQEIRNQAPLELLAWFDACQILSDKPLHAPLLGRGGLDGSMDFGVNFMQRLSDLYDPKSGQPSNLARRLLPSALFAESVPALLAASIGQFDPGGAGGPNATTGFESNSLINPWDFVFTLEGSLFFAATATKRLEQNGASELSYPFTILPLGSGSGGASISDENPAGAKRRPYEIWLPLWNRYTAFYEIKSLFMEGRVTIGRRPVRDGLDFARAVATLGVDRGISAFQRYGFLMRSGKAFFATPLARLQVKRNPQADLLTQLDWNGNGWLDSLRRFARDTKKAPGRIQQLVRRLEDEIFSLTQGGGHLALQNILTLIGQIQLVSAKSAKTRKAIAPVPQLGAEWALQADDRSHEYRLACALAGLTSMRNFVVPIKINEKTKRDDWSPGSTMAVWGGGDMESNLLRILDRRLLKAQQDQAEDKPLVGSPTASLAAVMAFLKGETDDRRIAGLLAGLINVDLPRHLSPPEVEAEQPSAAFCLLKPLFTPNKVLQRLGLLSEDAHLPLPREIVTLLRTGNREQVGRAIDIAKRRLRIAGLKLPAYPRSEPAIVGIDSSRLVAALMIPLAMGELARICKPFTPSQEAN